MAYTTINKGSNYFNTLIYTGDGTDDRSITGLGFQPDFCWFKDRTGANSHNLFDSVRGVNLPLLSNATNAELTGFDLFNSFDSDGFTISGATADNTNYNGSQFVSWSWKAANGTASNTNGSITSTVSANTTAGFSIVSFTGTGSAATVGHGLGKEVDCIAIKNRIDAAQWSFYHRSLGGTQYMAFNSTSAAATASTQWNNTDPTSSVFSVGTSNNTNDSGDGMIAYCFASIKGFSKFGSYVGTGNSIQSPFIYTGFKPAWVMIKRTDTTNNWIILDNKRDTNNPNNIELQANSNAADDTANIRFDMLSNGIKTRSTTNANNASGGTYIYMAFAENPFVTSTGIPGLAR